MLDTILRTKLKVPPLRPNLVPRPKLIKQLNLSLHQGHKLTLISAPAGFGKTTLICEWVAGSEHPCAWISLDTGDGEIARFLTYLIAALQTMNLSGGYGEKRKIGESALAMLQSPLPLPADSILTVILNDIAVEVDEIILVLDDYYLVDSPDVDQALTFLLEHMPTQMHLVIVTREDPSLPLARLRARGQLVELRASDLRFTTVDTAQFLNRVMGLNLSANEISALDDRTEGWIAGLQLAALSLQGRQDSSDMVNSFTGSHRFVLDYLVEEVLEQQSADVYRFLLQSAALNRLTGPLCDALTGDNNGQEMLDQLERANLFIAPLDDERQWYRYHHLFVDLLRQRQRQANPEQVPIMHRRASHWYGQSGFFAEAVEHAFLAKDFELASTQIGLVADALWVSGESAHFQRWLNALPHVLLTANPKLCIYYAWNLLAMGNRDAAAAALQACEEALEKNFSLPQRGPSQDQDQPLPLTVETARGRIATTKAFMSFYRGDIAGILDHAREALSILPEQELAWRSTATHILGDAFDFQGNMVDAYQYRLEAIGPRRQAANSFVFLIANMKLAIILRKRGELGQVLEICEAQYHFATESGMSQTVVAGWLLSIWGEVLAEMNDLDLAISLAKKGVEITERGGDLAMLAWSYLCSIRVHFSNGDLKGAQELISKLANRAVRYDFPPLFLNQNSAWQARIWLQQGEHEQVALYLHERAVHSQDELTYLREAEHIALARFLIDQNRSEEALELLRRLHKASEAGGRRSRMIEILLLKALAMRDKGDAKGAQLPLSDALLLAEPGGFVRIFMDEGPRVAQMISTAASRDLLPEYSKKLRSAFLAERQPRLDQPRRGPVKNSHDLIEHLSERELEVLDLVAQGLSNREIATRLYLALNTVKGHNRNIYGKLGVQRRTEAVARARELCLL